MSAPMTPKAAWGIVHALQKSLVGGRHGLDTVPKLIKRIIQGELWKGFYCEPMQSEVAHSSFERYVTDDLPTGLGTTIRMLKSICRDDVEALDAIDRATVGKQGSRTDIVDNINEVQRPTGTSRDAALRRLRKDRPDLLERVLANELSAHAAAVEAGFRKKPSQAEICVKAFRKAENRLEAMRLIVGEMQPHEAAVVRDWITEAINGG